MDSFKILLELKVELLLHGINFSNGDILNWLNQFSNGSKEPTHGLFNYHDSTNYVPNEITAIFNNETIKIETRNNKDSKFTLLLENDNAYIEYYDAKILIEIKKQPEFLMRKSPRGVSLKKYVNIMGDDCLRIYPKLYCDFDSVLLKCKYCGVNAKKEALNDDELLEEYLWAFDIAYKEFNPKYIFMSTGTHMNNEENNFFFQFFEKIKKYPMREKLLKNTVFVPAPNISYDDIDQFYGMGIGMLSFNIEIWDQKLFSEYCPGKQKFFGREQYLNLINYCSRKYGVGCVKTNFVLGLESLETIKDGIERLAENGCYSSGTIFYPTPGAYLDKNYQNQDVNYYLQVYSHIEQMAQKYSLKTPWSDDNRISGLEWDIKKVKELVYE